MRPCLALLLTSVSEIRLFVWHCVGITELTFPLDEFRVFVVCDALRGRVVAVGAGGVRAGRQAREGQAAQEQRVHAASSPRPVAAGFHRGLEPRPAPAPPIDLHGHRPGRFRDFVTAQEAFRLRFAR